MLAGMLRRHTCASYGRGARQAASWLQLQQQQQQQQQRASSSSSGGGRFERARQLVEESRRTGPREREIVVDRTGMFSPAAAGAHMPAVEKEPMTPLGQAIWDELEGSGDSQGAMTVAEFMRRCLLDPQHGYYKTQAREIGESGDFATAPELSQLFGETLAIWCVHFWEVLLGSPDKVHIVELGPGTGALMSDMLRTFRVFEPFKTRAHVHLVETSPAFRAQQEQTLQGPGAAGNSLPLTWHESFDDVPRDAPLLVVSNELLDAFPIHRFVNTKDGWREIMVKRTSSKLTPLHFDFAVADEENDGVRSFLASAGAQRALGRLEETQYRAELANAAEKTEMQDMEGMQFEWNPQALELVQSVASRVAEQQGAAVFVDYGPDEYTPEDTWRAYSKHSFVHPLSAPGTVDLTADVDFDALAQVVQSMDGVSCLGPVRQSIFLRSLGLDARMQELLSQEELTDEGAQTLAAGFKKLVHPNHMGHRFKALGFTSKSLAGEGDETEFIPGFPPEAIRQELEYDRSALDEVFDTPGDQKRSRSGASFSTCSELQPDAASAEHEQELR